MIRNYVVTAAAATFHSGILRLSEEQAAARSFGLVPTKKAGEFRIVSPVQFKRGEEIGFDGEINKAMLQDLDPAPAAGEGAPGGKGKKGKKGAAPAAGEGAPGDGEGEERDDSDLEDGKE